MSDLICDTCKTAVFITEEGVAAHITDEHLSGGRQPHLAVVFDHYSGCTYACNRQQRWAGHRTMNQNENKSEIPPTPGDLRRDLAALLNSYSRENVSGTPDFVLAGFLMDSLRAFDSATRARDKWWGVTPKIGGTIAAVDTPTPWVYVKDAVAPPTGNAD